jgi:hypothetical protein
MNLRKHKCIKCGYLCIELIEQKFLGEDRPFGVFQTGISHYENITKYQEYTVKERKGDFKLQRGRKNLFCFRREATFEIELDDILKTHQSSESNKCPELDDLVNKARKCRYYTNYIPGYSPIQHLTKMEVIERERTNRYWSLLYLIIGSLLTIAGGFIIKLLFDK